MLIFKLVIPPVLALSFGLLPAFAQGTGLGAPPVHRSPIEAAPIDLTGYWVSLVTEDWRFRMFTPPKGDYTAVPLNPEGRKVAANWNPAADESAGEQCKSYGAPNIMRKPGRLHVTWQDDDTLKLEFDAGTQTRFLSFRSSAAGKGNDRQGVSQASWDLMPASISSLGGIVNLAAGATDPQNGSLKVVTTKFKPGYLRTNGAPYSADAVLTEYFDLVRGPNGETYLLVSSILQDPTYLTQPFMLTTQWRKQQDGSGWNPMPCSVR